MKEPIVFKPWNWRVKHRIRPGICLGMTLFFCVSLFSKLVFANPSLLLQEEKALQAAGDFAQSSVVRVETFGGREIVEDSAVAAGPSSGTIVDSDGWIITSLFQFRADPPAITVVLSNGERKSTRPLHCWM